MSVTSHRRERRQGQKVLDRQYAKAKGTPSPTLSPERLVEYRNQVLDRAEELLDVIVAQVQEYSPKPGQRDVALAKTIACIADKVIEASDLLCTLAQVEELSSPGRKAAV